MTMYCPAIPQIARSRLERLSSLAVFGVIACLVGLPPRVHAQTNISITGIVVDSLSSLPIEGADVRVVSGDRGTVTDAAGRFTLRSLPLGIFDLQVQRMGYAPAHVSGVEVIEGAPRYVRLALTPLPYELDGQQIVREGRNLAAQEGIRRLTQADIARAGYQSVGEALAALPGVQIYGGRETPGGTRVSVAGESPLRVAILFDGLPLATGPDGAVDLDEIPLSAVAAVEVVPGARSAGSGEGAIGGTVNILTRSRVATADRRVSMSSGPDGAYLGSAAGGVSFVNVSSHWSFEHAGHGDSYRYPSGDTSVERTGVGLNTWRSHLAVSPNAVPSLQISGFWYDADVGMPGALQQVTPHATNGTSRLRAQAIWSPQAHTTVDFGGGLWYESSNERFRSPEKMVADDEWREQFAGGRLHATANAAGVSTRLEFEARERSLEGINHQRPQLSFGQQDITEFSSRGLLRRSFDFGSHHFTLSASVALDGDDLNAPFTSPHVDAAWSVPWGLHARAGWGKSFRRPLLTSLFWKADAYAVGDPSLRPERSNEWDAAIGVARGMIELDVRYFERRIRDIITWQRTTVTGQYKPLNIDRSMMIGREDHAALHLVHHVLSVEYTHVFTDARDRSSDVNYNGQTLVLTPRHMHEGSITTEIGRWQGALSGRWVSLRYIRRQNDPNKTLRPYRVFNGRLACTLWGGAPRVDLSVRMENLTNEYYELLERYPAPGRTWSVATTITF